MRKPNKWIAGIAALLLSPFFGMLYVAKPRWAFVYIAVSILIFTTSFMVGGLEWVGVFLLPVTLAGAAHAYLAAARYPDGVPRPFYSKWYGLLCVWILFFSLIFIFRAFLFEPFRVPASSMLPSIEVGQNVVVSKWGYGNKGTFGVTVRKGAVSVPINRGDVMVFVYPASSERLDYVKRVIGLPGDLVEYKNKLLTINAQPATYRDLGKYEHIDHTGNSVSARLISERIGTVEYRVLIKPDSPTIFADNVSLSGRQNCTYHRDGFTCRVPVKHYFVLGDNRDASNDSRYWGVVPEDHFVGKVINLKL